MMQSTIATLGDNCHTSVSTRAHKNNYFNIVYPLHSPSSMWRAKVFADSSSSSSYSDSTELPRPKRKQSAPVTSQDTTKSDRITFHLLPLANLKAIFGNFHCWSFFVAEYSHAESHTRAVLRALSPDMLPHHVLRAGAVKRATLCSGFIQRVFCSFGGINLKRCFTVFYGLNLAQCVCTGYIES